MRERPAQRAAATEAVRVDAQERVERAGADRSRRGHDRGDDEQDDPGGRPGAEREPCRERSRCDDEGAEQPIERIAHLVGAADLASSPASLAAGKVWLLLTSGFVVVGPPLPQIATIAVLAALVIRFRGSRTFWTAALLGRVGSPLVVYALVVYALVVLRSGHRGRLADFRALCCAGRPARAAAP